MIDLLYRRPSTRYSSSESSLGTGTRKSDLSLKDGIPERLNFECIVGGLTSAPCKLDDFVNYLRYMNGNPNDLQFYLWIREYTKRFCKLSEGEQILSPLAELEPTKEGSQTSLVPSFRGEDLTFGDDIKLQPFMTAQQPFRDEINRVISLYLIPNAPLPLSIAASDCQRTVTAFEQTTHPSALSAVLPEIEDKILNQAHPAFIRYTLSNATKTRIEFVVYLGSSLIITAFILAIILTLSKVSRWTRLSTIFFLFPGLNMLANARRGLCFLLVILGMSRNLTPWEVYEVQNGDVERGKQSIDFDEFDEMAKRDEQVRVRVFVSEYHNRPMMSRVFEKRVTVKDPEVRRLQLSIIAANALIVGTITAIFEIVFVALPNGNFF